MHVAGPTEITRGPERRHEVALMCYAVLAVTTVFIVDLAAPPGVVGSVAYVAAVLLASGIPGKRAVFAVAIVCSVLAVLGLFLSPSPGGFESPNVLTNLGLALFLIWVTLALCLRRKQTSHLLHRAQDSSQSAAFDRDSANHASTEPMKERAIADSILLSIQEGVTIYDQDFLLVAWNEKYGEMNITPREHIKQGLHIEDTYRYAAKLGVFGPGDPTEIATERIEQVYAGKSPAVEDLHCSDGQIIEIRRYFLPDIGVAAVFSNVTANRRMSAQVRRSEDLELLARVAGGFCHDFNNVLQAIVTNLQLAIDFKQTECIQPALDAAQSGVDLAGTMLRLARPKELPEEESEFDVVEAIATTVTWMSRVVGGDVKVELENHIRRAFVQANKGKFATSLANLIVNSCDAMEQRGLIRIEVSQRHDRVKIDVIDSGCGMPEEVLLKAANPFYSTKGLRGTGLGVYEAKTFVESLGGLFSLSSQVGIGSRVSMEIPTVLRVS